MLAKIDALERLSSPRDRGLMTADTGLTGGGMNSRMKLMPFVVMSAVLLASCADAKEGETNAATQPPPSAHTQSDEGPIYFNISDDPYSPSFLHLDEIERQGGNAFLVARTDLFNRGQPNAFGLGTIWEIDCDGGRMRIIRAARLALGVHEPEIVEMPTEWVQPEGRIGRTMQDLVCIGEASLNPDKVFRGDMWEYSQKFLGGL